MLGLSSLSVIWRLSHTSKFNNPAVVTLVSVFLMLVDTFSCVNDLFQDFSYENVSLLF